MIPLAASEMVATGVVKRLPLPLCATPSDPIPIPEDDDDDDNDSTDNPLPLPVPMLLFEPELMPGVDMGVRVFFDAATRLRAA